ncbi:hypothetical protein P9A16_31700 [Shinella sp. 838]|uniref:hypothetical protein n=1 Tax=Shinella sp. 838 TaxID=3038164 RepID=UPI002415835A|nr:hypothetical protein [Shinella sp. 838]MDG4675667.1 hypothetical protein [Shinella sp. 838]
MMTEARKTIAPMSECIGLKAAAEYAQVDERTMRRWHKNHGLGFKRIGGPNARLMFSITELNAYLAGDGEALMHLRNGDYEHEALAVYRRITGIVL